MLNLGSAKDSFQAIDQLELQLMKFSLSFLSIVFFLIFLSDAQAQGLVLDHHHQENHQSSLLPSCGSFELMKHMDGRADHFMELSDNFILNLKKVIKHQGAQKANNIYRIPVVFHVVHNNENENLADEVIENQLQVMNDAFRRTNADAVDTRAEFLDYVGDSNIEFFLAETDPDGGSTSGITRTSTDIEHFGGILPYSASQTPEITAWVTDSLFLNLFRITQSDQGGVDAWDTDRYLNIWLGDLRIFEPEINNFEELVYLGLATPPVDHFNWGPEITAPLSGFSQGVIMHYVAIGANNPNNYPSPYQVFNSAASSGKVLVHEVGHYLGLRHIWGDGNCTVDDFIDDTPLCSAPGQWDCNLSSNTCVDDIGGLDLPNMVENYMDYTSGTCQNAFTFGQIDIMSEVLTAYRPDLAEVIVSVDDKEEKQEIGFQVYPNPFLEQVNIEVELKLHQQEAMSIQLFDPLGNTILSNKRQLHPGKNTFTFQLLDLPNGVYFLNLFSRNTHQSYRLIKH